MIIVTHAAHYATANGKMLTAVHASDRLMWRELYERRGISVARLKLINMEKGYCEWTTLNDSLK